MFSKNLCAETSRNKNNTDGVAGRNQRALRLLPVVELLVSRLIGPSQSAAMARLEEEEREMNKTYFTVRITINKQTTMK